MNETYDDRVEEDSEFSLEEKYECSLDDECSCNVKPRGYCGIVSEANWAVIHEMECQFPVMPIGCHWVQKCPAAL